MPDEITIRADGTAEAAFALQPAWHGLGVVFDHPMSSEEALKAAQLDWRVRQDSLWRADADCEGVGSISNFISPVEGYAANVRADTDELLGVVSDQYRVVQNVEAFEFLDALIENREMQYESAFSLRGGRRVVLLGRLPQVDLVTKDDAVRRFVLMSLSHDGTAAIRFGPCATRVVCANTYAMAEREGTIDSLSIRHQGDVKLKLQEARRIIGLANEQFDRYAELARTLAEKKFARDEWLRFLDVTCPELCADDPDWTDRRAEKVAETRLAITQAFLNERQMLAGIERSAWAAYNAVAEHVDHLPRRGATRTRQAEARFNVTLYGVGRNMKQRALETACKVAGVECTVAA